MRINYLNRDINDLVCQLAKDFSKGTITLKDCDNQLTGFFLALSSAKIYSKASCICQKQGALAQLSDKIYDSLGI